MRMIQKETPPILDGAGEFSTTRASGRASCQIPEDALGTRSRREERSKEILALEEVGLLVPYC